MIYLRLAFFSLLIALNTADMAFSAEKNGNQPESETLQSTGTCRVCDYTCIACANGCCLY